MWRRALILLLVTVLLLSGCVAKASVRTPTFDASLLPTVPAASTIEGSDPTSRAASLVAMTADALPSTDAGWVAAYREFDIPIVVRRASSASADPVGPYWSQVWSLSGLSRGRATIPLSDAASILSKARNAGVDGNAVLAQLRSDASGSDARVATLARFVSAKSVANGGADPLDPATAADAVRLDAATIQLFAWDTLRRALLRAAAPDGTPRAAAPLRIAPATSVERTASSTPCSELWGGQDETSWINWVANKVGGPAAEKLAGETIGTFLSQANVIVTLLSLIAQVNAMELTTSSQPAILVRNWEAADGAEAHLEFRLSYNASLLDSNNQALCAVVTAANALGVGLSLPADGAPIAGAEVKLEGIKNFPDKIIYNDPGTEGFDKIETDAEGVAKAVTQGRARPVSLPKNSKEKPDEYGFAVSSQVEESGAQSILNIFIDGLSAAKGGPIGAALDFAKLYHFDLGEQYFPFIDYESGYRVDQAWLGGGYRVTGEVCDLELPFILQLNGSPSGAFVGPLQVFPHEDGTFRYAVQGVFGGAAQGVGNGAGYSTVTDNGAQLFLDGGQFTATLPPPVGTIPIGPGGQHFVGALTDPIVLKSDPTTCKGQ